MQIKTELLVRRIDKVSQDPVKNAQLTKRGDVIVVKEAPTIWSQKERENPAWLILQTDMDYQDAIAFLESEVGFLDGSEANALKRRRSKSIDLDQAAIDLPLVAPDRAHKITENFELPFQFSKELIASYAKVKA